MIGVTGSRVCDDPSGEQSPGLTPSPTAPLTLSAVGPSGHTEVSRRFSGAAGMPMASADSPDEPVTSSPLVEKDSKTFHGSSSFSPPNTCGIRSFGQAEPSSLCERRGRVRQLRFTQSFSETLPPTADMPLGRSLDPEWGEYDRARVYTTKSSVGDCLYVRLALGHASWDGFIDHGSSINLVNEQTVLSLMREDPSAVSLETGKLLATAAFSSQWVLRRKVWLRFTIGAHSFRQLFWVSPQMEDDLLLGMPFLREHGSTVHTGRTPGSDWIRFADSKVRYPLRQHRNGLRSGLVALVAAEDSSVPAYSGSPIDVRLKGRHDRVWPARELEGVLVPALTQGRHKLFPAGQTLTMDASNSAVLDLWNVGSGAKKVRKGEVVAYLDPQLLETRRDPKGRPYLYQHMQGGLATVIDARRPLAAKVTQVGAATWDPVPVGVLTSLDPEAPRVLALSGEERKQLAAGLEEEARALQDHIDEAVTYGEGKPEYTYLDVNIDQSLTPSQREQIRAFVEKHQEFFMPILSAYPNPKLPKWSRLRIRLKDDVAPWKFRAYPLTPLKREAMERILKKQLSRGMISHSCSPYALPAFLVGKASGGHRLVIDARRLNKHIQKSSYPLPRIHDILDRLAGYSFFNSIDLADGFHQIALELASRKYTAFVTETGLYEENTVPMGLSTAPNHFQYVVNRLLNGTALARDESTSTSESASQTAKPVGPGTDHDLHENLLVHDCFVYIDDVLVAGRTLEESLHRLGKVIARLSHFGLRGKAPKCHLGMRSLKFLGTIVSERGREPDPKKIEALIMVESPHLDKRNDRATTRLQSFLGLGNYYRHHIQSFASIAAPLYRLLEKDKRVTRDWGAEHTRAFNSLKKCFTSAPLLLAHPDWSRPFELLSDASKTHIGGVLQQRSESTNQPAVVCYYSRSLSRAERKWHMTHLEALAVVACLKAYSKYFRLPGPHKVFTDHQALIWLRENQYADSTHRVARWFAFLDSFESSLHFVSGRENEAADAMTRMYEGEEDIFTWTAFHDYDWQFQVLCENLPESLTVVCEVGYPTSPRGKACFLAKGKRWRALAPTLMESRQAAYAESEVIVAVPPPKRVAVASLFRHLRRSRVPWAVWCPLRVLQSAVFREPDFQIITTQGRMGSGAASGAIPTRGVWVTHGILSSNVLYDKGARPAVGSVAHKEARAVAAFVRSVSVQGDWWDWDVATRDRDPSVEAVHPNPFPVMQHLVDSWIPTGQVRSTKYWSCMSARCARALGKCPLVNADSHLDSGLNSFRGERVWRTQAVHPERDRFKLSAAVRREIARLAREAENEDTSGSSTPPPIPEGTSPSFLEVVRTYQADDPVCQDILRLWAEKSRRVEMARQPPSSFYVVLEGLVYLRDNRQYLDLLYIPRSLRLHLLHVVHNSRFYFHPGGTRMYETLVRQVYWPRMKADADDYCQRCWTCVRSKRVQPLRKGVAMALIPSRPFQIVGVDIYGPLPESEDADVRNSGYRYILSVVDHFSRWVRLLPLREDPTAEVIAKTLATEWIPQFGVPGLLVTDQGSEFTARLLQEIGHLLGMRVHSVPTESQWRNGKVERIHRYLNHRLRIWRREVNAAWHLALPYIEMSHHFMSLPAFKRSPFEILFGTAPRLPFLTRVNDHLGWGEARLFVAEFRDQLLAVQAEVREREKKVSAASVARRQARQKPASFALGDKVFVFTKGTKNKLDYLWSEPVAVVGLPNDTTVEVQYPSGLRKRVPKERVHRADNPLDFSKLADGPLISGYPHLLLTAQPTPMNPDGDKLETYVITLGSPPPEGKGRPATQPSRPEERQCMLRWGDYLAHLTDDGNAWTVSQYLGYNDEHDTSDFPSCLCLRRLDRYPASSPIGPWRYRWSAEHGSDVLAGVHLGHNDPPSAKNTGELCSLWDYVPESAVLAVVSLRADNRLDNTSWSRLLSAASDRGLPQDFLMQ